MLARVPAYDYGKINFSLTKKPSNSIQKLFMTETFGIIVLTGILFQFLMKIPN